MLPSSKLTHCQVPEIVYLHSLTTRCNCCCFMMIWLQCNKCSNGDLFVVIVVQGRD